MDRQIENHDSQDHACMVHHAVKIHTTQLQMHIVQTADVCSDLKCPSLVNLQLVIILLLNVKA